MKVARIKKALLVLFAVLTLFSSVTLVSCNRKYDEKEVLENAELLLKKAETLNEVYYGRGISYIVSQYQTGDYYEADPFHLATLGFTTVDELKSLTLETFTVGYSNELFSTRLSSNGTTTRYYQKYDDLAMQEPVCIMVYSRPTVLKKGTIVYDYSTLRVTGVKKQTVFVSVDATVYSDDGKSQRVSITIDLIEEDNGWRIDNPCYANYDSTKD